MPKNNYTPNSRRVIPRIHRTSHGMSRTRIHQLWCDLHTRCYNPKFKQYADWGGRGIGICAGFRAFLAFYAKMGEPPSPKHSLDRIDNDGNYSCGECSQCIENGWPLNVQWADRIQQNNNKRSNTFYEYNGESHTIADWSRITGIDQRSIRQRVVVYKFTVGQALGYEPHPRPTKYKQRSSP